jgi:hypothetical protein
MADTLTGGINAMNEFIGSDKKIYTAVHLCTVPMNQQSDKTKRHTAISFLLLILYVFKQASVLRC